MTNKTLRDYINLIENAQQGVAEGSEGKESLEDWENRMKKLGYKITKDNKTGTYHAWQGTTHKGSHRTQGVAKDSDAK